MAIDPIPYPWVRFLLEPTSSIDSTVLQVFSSPQHCIVDSIFLCNTSGQEIFVDISIKATRENVEKTCFVSKRIFLPINGEVQVIDTTLYLQSGDIIFANSDFSENTFDCEVSYRELTELSSITANDPFSYPWVNFLMTPTIGIESTPTLIFGSEHNSVIDSIILCNTSQNDIYVDIYSLTERNLIAKNNYVFKKIFLPINGYFQFGKDSSLQMEAGDLFYANSDFSSNTFDCLVSHRALIEQPV